jgi:uncharacterized membrane protein YuzA (DUF378 family)
MKTLKWLCFILVVIGALNWGLVGLFNFNLVEVLFQEGSLLTRLVYILVGIAAVVLILIKFKAKKQ